MFPCRARPCGPVFYALYVTIDNTPPLKVQINVFAGKYNSTKALKIPQKSLNFEVQNFCHEKMFTSLHGYAIPGFFTYCWLRKESSCCAKRHL